MIATIQKTTIPEVSRLVDSGRKNRMGGKVESENSKCVREMANAHVTWYFELYKELKKSFPLLSMNELRKTPMQYPSRSESKCSCGDFHKRIKSKFTEDEVNTINKEFFKLVGRSSNKKINDITESWISKVISRAKDFTGSIYMSRLFNVIFESSEWAYNKVKSIWDRTASRSQSWASENPLTGPSNTVVDINAPWVRKLRIDGFNRISSKITQFFLPLAKKEILTGILSGLSWDQISRSLHRKAGLGALWHWQRLVRSEFAEAADKSSIDRFNKMGVKYVKWNASINRCVICEGHASFNGGYYKMGDAPSIIGDTHPNCTCVKDPVFRLPSSIAV